MGEDGSLQLNRSIEGLKGKLKIRVMERWLTVILPADSVLNEPNLELTLVSIFLTFSSIATSLLKLSPELHPFIALFSGHGSKGLKTIGDRTPNDIANIVATFRDILPVQSSIDTKGQAGLIRRLCRPKQLFLRQDDSDG
jgi:hypothetical protein